MNWRSSYHWPKKKEQLSKKKKRIERAEEFDPKNKAAEKETGLGINHLKARLSWEVKLCCVDHTHTHTKKLYLYHRFGFGSNKKKFEEKKSLHHIYLFLKQKSSHNNNITITLNYTLFPIFQPEFLFQDLF